MLHQVVTGYHEFCVQREAVLRKVAERLDGELVVAVAQAEDPLHQICGIALIRIRTILRAQRC